MIRQWGNGRFYGLLQAFWRVFYWGSVVQKKRCFVYALCEMQKIDSRYDSKIL